MGPLYFDYGFGPFRWVCMSENPEDLAKSDAIAVKVLEEESKTAPEEIQGQLHDNIHWIEEAGRNKLVVGSQARILYADSEGRTKIGSVHSTRLSARARLPLLSFSVETTTTFQEQTLHSVRLPIFMTVHRSQPIWLSRTLSESSIPWRRMGIYRQWWRRRLGRSYQRRLRYGRSMALLILTDISPICSSGM